MVIALTKSNDKGLMEYQSPDNIFVTPESKDVLNTN